MASLFSAQKPLGTTGRANEDCFMEMVNVLIHRLTEVRVGNEVANTDQLMKLMHEDALK